MKGRHRVSGRFVALLSMIALATSPIGADEKTGCEIYSAFWSSEEPPSTEELNVSITATKLRSGRFTGMAGLKWQPSEGETGLVASIVIEPCETKFRHRDFTVSVEDETYACVGHARTGKGNWLFPGDDVWLVRANGNGQLQVDLVFAVPSGFEEGTLHYRGKDVGGVTIAAD